MAIFAVQGLADLDRVIIPHFEAYPLRAKKARDFELFKEAVRFIAERKRNKRSNNLWSNAELSRIIEIRDAMKNIRKYSEELAEVPPVVPMSITGPQQMSFSFTGTGISKVLVFAEHGLGSSCSGEESDD